ncbi:MAG: extracellular solute-binding protein [Lachnospiraceae bacterium]|nr:extracellular solute-binding protein [Lachnospiraceae bacterium]
MMKTGRFPMLTLPLLTAGLICLTGCGGQAGDAVTLRVCNWEEYIDEGDWGDDEAIELDDGTVIFGENSLTDDFEEWYYEEYGEKVKVEYSTFGTNEELYNQITIGDVYDLACPSEYMIMKMMREGMLTPYSDDFHDTDKEENYYARGLSPYIRGVYENLSIEGEPLSRYASGYMWGTLGIVYNPDEVSEEEAAHWSLLLDHDYYRRVTIKDSVRDAYFAAAAINYYDEITAPDFVNAPDYHDRLSAVLNRTDEETVEAVEKVLTQAKNNVYSFETDSGKADMVTGKVIANEQWSGDGVYTLDQADEDGVTLCYSAPKEGTNLWFDGWVMLKSGIEEDARKQHAAEAFVNYISRPENVVRNMYYIGYTSVISGGDSDMVFDYLEYNYGADEEEDEDLVLYDNIGYFFEADTDEANEKYSVLTTADQTKRQLFAQYPPKDVVDRSVVMACFTDESNERVNRAWTNVRCFDLKSLFR